ncbi:hypothetical protein HPE56_02705 [Maribacter sp. ANRC-HE7]|uniref:Tetratricopeptide repeat-containing protein n=1 Tax=Maribacter aquimaris TaxID=2737171 RepID=A0ABR7UWX6_9FLAO|nr:hypothetical protein [Maribacter aquimaris]MBD0776692.1 hypothetical protein [Maribacter aquimaris]
MKKTVTLILLFMATMVSAQDKFTSGMQKAFEYWGNGDVLEASNLFDRISMAEPDNWLPSYYGAQVNTVASFGEQDEGKVSQQLGKAQEFIDLAKVISPNNPEIMVQQAMIYTAWIAFDGATYGMTLSGKVVALYQKALELAPENPRVVFSKAEWDMGCARYFGQDTAPFCKDVERALELFATFKPESVFHPNWGKDRAEEIVKNCK